MADKRAARVRAAKAAAASRRGIAGKAARARAGAANKQKRIDPGWRWDDALPLAQAKQMGNTIYLSGQVAYDAEGTLVGKGDMKAQTLQVFRNIKEVLAAAGATLEHIIKITTYITDQKKFMDMLEARREVFGDNPPASTAVVVAGLAFPGLLVEVEAIAIKP